LRYSCSPSTSRPTADLLADRAVYLSPGSVEKYVMRVFGKPRLPPSEKDNRRVLAVLRYLDS
jgi:hypothetical protein